MTSFVTFSKLKYRFVPVIVLLLLINFLYINTQAQSAQLQAKYDSQKSEINSQIGTINSELDKLSSSFYNISARKNSLKEEVASLQSEIDKVNNLINETKITINKLDEQIQINQEQLNELQKQMQIIIREIQKQDRVSPLESLLTSKNLSEVLSNIYNLSTLQIQATKLNKKVEIAQAELQNNRNIQIETQKSLDNSQFLLKSKQDGVQLLLEQTKGEEARYQELINQVNEQKNQANSQLIAIDAEFDARIQEELEEKAKQNARNGNISGGYTNGGDGDGCFFKDSRALNAPKGFFASPTDGYVSQNFWCQGVYGHDGWDIANGSGTPIRASADGVVVNSGFHSGGFGNFVLLKHTLPSGQNVYTLYAHMNAPTNASGGVSQGQVIGYMGSTGFSTGPHLHFMIISSSYESTGNLGCHYGSSKCYDPASVF
jgi:murein DD-endopeptidase MepM/ murein hydrolase activator NlpD